jgi:hypothetical protein
MVFNATFNNISVLLVEETEVPEKTTDLSQVTDKLTMLVVIGTDCIGSCKSNYHTITTTTAPLFWVFFLGGGGGGV